MIPTIAVSMTTAAICIASAVMKLRRDERVVRSVHDVVGVPMDRFPALAVIELSGAAGVLLGLWIAPIGIAAAIGLTCYFIGAVMAHVVVGDTAGMVSPLLPLALSIAALVLHVLSM